MGRRPTISRDRLLDLAEGIVRAEGAKELTVGALAREAGISKGGVQYSFASKDALIEALVARWTHQFDRLLDAEGAASPVELIHRYIRAMRTSQQAMDAKMAGLMAGYFQNPDNLDETRRWYRQMFERLVGDDEAARAARVAFLAVEGLFLMRMAGLDEDGSWAGFLDDAEAVLARMTGQSPS